MKNSSENQVKSSLELSLFVLEQYKWLIDSYVLDFFVENHWKNLPLSWQETFTAKNFPINELSFLLKSDDPCEKISVVLPLSLLTLRKVIQMLSISRKPEKVDKGHFPGFTDHPKLRNLFTKHVKCKKRHEIEKMSALCAKTANKKEVEYLVDVGGGLGHLSRVLAFGHGKRVCCVEKQESLNLQASVLDQQFLKFAQKYLKEDEFKLLHPPFHLNYTISSNMNARSFINELKCGVFGLGEEDKFSVGIIGLHPCGDLGPVLLNLFRTCPEVKFIAVVGCCYMKLTDHGYPLSQYLKRMREKVPRRAYLSYEAREVACHAIEMYHERLSRGQFDDLKIHAYRSALEKIIVRSWPHLRHSGLRSVKYRECTSFQEYCEKAVGNLGVKLAHVDMEENADCLEWKKVAIFYTLRLMLAPLVESVILNDRWLSIQESNTTTCSLVAAFEPHLSPRNHILLATK